MFLGARIPRPAAALQAGASSMSLTLEFFLPEDLQQLPGCGPGHPALGCPAGEVVSQRDPEGPAIFSHPVSLSPVPAVFLL